MTTTPAACTRKKANKHARYAKRTHFIGRAHSTHTAHTQHTQHTHFSCANAARPPEFFSSLLDDRARACEGCCCAHKSKGGGAHTHAHAPHTSAPLPHTQQTQLSCGARARCIIIIIIIITHHDFGCCWGWAHTHTNCRTHIKRHSPPTAAGQAFSASLSDVSRSLILAKRLFFALAFFDEKEVKISLQKLLGLDERELARWGARNRGVWGWLSLSPPSVGATAGCTFVCLAT